MWFPNWLRCRPSDRRSRDRRHVRPRLEALGERALPATYYAATAADLIADINAANKGNGASTIVLTAPTTSHYLLTAVNNTADGATGLPVVKRNLTIVGNGDAVGRDNSTAGVPGFRLFDVASGGSLTLQNLTLGGGRLWWGSGASAEGGAIFNRGTLVLSGVTINGNGVSGAPGADSTNKAGGAGADAAGGGIWSNGSLTVENGCVIAGNTATGGDGGYGHGPDQWGPGGNAYGGGICVAGGTATITDSEIGTYDPLGGWGVGNTAQGGAGANVRGTGVRSASGYGGGIYVAGGTVTMNADRVEANTAQGGMAAPPGAGSASFWISGFGYGGGLYAAGGSTTLTNDTVDRNVAGTFENGGTNIYYLNGYGGGIAIVSGATVYLDSFTVANTNGNSSWQAFDIDGAYIPLP